MFRQRFVAKTIIDVFQGTKIIPTLFVQFARIDQKHVVFCEFHALGAEQALFLLPTMKHGNRYGEKKKKSALMFLTAASVS